MRVESTLLLGGPMGDWFDVGLCGSVGFGKFKPSFQLLDGIARYGCSHKPQKPAPECRPKSHTNVPTTMLLDTVQIPVSFGTG